MIGLPYNYHLQQAGKILQRGWEYPDGSSFCGNGLGLNLSIHYRYSKHLAFEAGFRTQPICLEVHDQYFMKNSAVPGTDFGNRSVDIPIAENGNFIFAGSYNTYFLKGYHFFGSERRTSFYLSTGIALNWLSDKTSMSASFYNLPTDEKLELRVNYRPFFVSSFLEGGIQIVPSQQRHPGRGGPVYFIDLKYDFSGKVITGDYQNIQGGTTAYQDYVTSNGNILSFGIRIGGAIWSRADTAHKFKAKSRKKISPKKVSPHRDRTKLDSYQLNP